MPKKKTAALKRRTTKASAGAIALPKTGKNEIYKGIIVDEHGKPLRHVIEIVGNHGSANWARAGEIANKAGAKRPDRREGALLRASDPRGQTGWFWLDEEYEGDADYAYAQFFGYGDQYDCHKVNEFKVRLVRSISILD